MELAWLADEEPAIAIVVDKVARIAMTNLIDRKKIFPRMTRFPLKGQ
jgi:hypothetical protein